MTALELAAVHQHDQTGSLPIVSRALIEAEARCKRLEHVLRRIVENPEAQIGGHIRAEAVAALREPGGSE